MRAIVASRSASLELALGHLAVEVGGDAGDDGVGAVRLPRPHDDVEPGSGRHLGQPGTHDPRPDDAHRADVTHRQHRSYPAVTSPTLQPVVAR